MITYPDGTVLVTKVLNNDFKEEALDAVDIPINTSGSPYQDVAVTGTNLQSAFQNLCEFVDTISGGSSGGPVAHSDTTGRNDPDQHSLEAITTSGAGSVLYALSGAIQELPVGADGQVLSLSNGLPEWADQSGGPGGGIGSINDLTSTTQTLTTGTSGTDFNIASSGAIHTFNLPNASSSARGVLSTGSQTIAGNKTFTDSISVSGNVNTSNIGTISGTNMTNINGYVREVSPATPLSSAGSQVINCASQSTWRKTGGAATITFSNMSENQLVTMVFEAIGSAYIITWEGETFRWPSGATPAPSAITGTFDVYTFMKIGGIVYANAILNMK